MNSKMNIEIEKEEKEENLDEFRNIFRKYDK